MSDSPVCAGPLEESLALERVGKLAEALRKTAQALEAAEAQQDPQALGAALVAEGRVRFRMGQYAQARLLAEKTLALSPCRYPAHADALLLLGMCAAETNSLIDAEKYYRQAADLARELGYPLAHARALHDLASGVYLPRGQFELAVSTDEEAYRVAQAHSLQDWLYFPLITIAWACQITAQRAGLTAALEELARVLPPDWAAYGYYEVFSAELALSDGDLDRALQIFTSARSHAETSGDPALIIFARLGLSRYHLVQGNAPAARTWAGDALACASHLGYQHLAGKALVEHGRTNALCGDLAAAESDLLEAVQIFTTLGAAFDLARARLVLAAVLDAAPAERAEAARQEFIRAARTILANGYEFLLDQERALAFPLIAGYLNSPEQGAAEASGQLLEHLRLLPPEPLRVAALGGLQVWKSGQRIAKRLLRQRRAGELLALLLLSPGHTCPIEQIVETMWPEKELPAARILFHHATSALRRALEPELPDKFPSRYLVVEEGLASLRLPPGFMPDWEAFQAHCRSGNWEAALALYGGELLPEFPYADWATTPRLQLNLLYQRALLAHAETSLAAGRFAAALESSQRLLAQEPWQEQAVLTGMRASLGFGDRAGALRLYLRLRDTLRGELGVEPRADLQSLYLAIVQA